MMNPYGRDPNSGMERFNRQRERRARENISRGKRLIGLFILLIVIVGGIIVLIALR